MQQQPPVRAQALTTTAALEQLRPEWQRLWDGVPCATPFQSPDWLLPWWRHIGRGRLACVALRCGATGELLGLAPLYIWADPASGRRQLMPLGIATTDYLDPLLRPGREAAALACLFSHLQGQAAHWDVLHWPQLRTGAPLPAARPPGWHTGLAAAQPHPVLPLAGRPQPACPRLPDSPRLAVPRLPDSQRLAVPRLPDSQRLAVPRLPIPPRMAQNLRTARSRAARAGRLELRTAQAQDVPAFLDALARLHRQRWQARGLPGALDEASVLDCHREAAPLLQARGLLRLYGLLLDGACIAALYALADAPHAAQPRHYYYLGGFDPAFGALSPGTLVVGHAIEQAMAEGALAFDFLRGAEPYKYRWGASDQPMQAMDAWLLQPAQDRIASAQGALP